MEDRELFAFWRRQFDELGNQLRSGGDTSVMIEFDPDQMLVEVDLAEDIGGGVRYIAALVALQYNIALKSEWYLASGLTVGDAPDLRFDMLERGVLNCTAQELLGVLADWRATSTEVSPSARHFARHCSGFRDYEGWPEVYGLPSWGNTTDQELDELGAESCTRRDILRSPEEIARVVRELPAETMIFWGVAVDRFCPEDAGLLDEAIEAIRPD